MALDDRRTLYYPVQFWTITNPLKCYNIISRKDAGVNAMLRKLCRGMYNLFTWPFRALRRCFKRNEEPEQKVENFNSIRPPFSLRRKRSAEYTAIRPKFHLVQKTRSEENFHIQYRPLFIPDYFSALSDVKNDKDFKEARKKAEEKFKETRKKTERIEERKKLMDRLKEMDEEEGLKPKPKLPTPSPPSSDSE